MAKNAGNNNRLEIKELHEVATKLEKTGSEEKIYEILMDATEQILDFYACSIDILVEDNFVVKAMRGGVQEEGTRYPIEGIAGKTVKNSKSYLIPDLYKEKDAIPKSEKYHSAISIPIGDIGVFQALSEEIEHFDERDLELTEILMNHAAEAIKRLRSEEALRKKNEIVKRLHDTAIKMGDCTKEEEIYDLAVKDAKNVLEFYVCSILLEHEGEAFQVKATTSENYDMGDIIPMGDSIYTKTYLEKKSYLVNNLDDFKGAKPSSLDFKSVISVPIGEIGVFQAISDQVNNFDEDDLELAELLISHLSESINKLRSEKKVRESEQRYRGIFNNTGTAKVLIDSDLKVELVNNEFEALSGYKKKELERHIIFRDFLFEDDIDKIINFIETAGNVKSKNVSEKYELRFIDKFGNVKETIGAISNIPGTDKFNLSIMDITDFKWAIEELEKSEKKYQTIFEKSGTAMVKVRKDTIIEMVNSKFVEMFGYTKKEVEGKISWTELVGEKCLPKMEKYHQNRRIDPDSVPTSYECEVIDKSGNSRKVILNVSMIPETDKSLVSLIDISDKEDFVEFQSMLDGLDIGMFILNSEGIVIKANGTVLNMFNIDEEDVVKRDYKETILSNFENIIEELKSNESKFSMSKKEFEDRDGNSFEVEINSSFIRQLDNDESYILCQISPIKEIERI
ncbi:MAG: PAS domain S-box protein [Thermoplasmatota archaeon]